MAGGNHLPDPEFSKWCGSYIDEMLDVHRMARPAPRTSAVWGCSNLGDFMCGFFVGEMIGAITATFQARFGRRPSADEHMAIADAVEARAPEIQDVFLRHN